MRNDDVPPLPELLVVGPTESPRVSAFVETARRWGAPGVTVVSYIDVIDRKCDPPGAGTLVRLESPGACAGTTRALLKAGIAALAADGGVPISSAEIDQLTCGRGEMLHPRQWFLGLRETLNELVSRWDHPEIRWMSTPASIVTAFDKTACLDLWSTAGLPIPPQHRGVSTYADLRRKIPDTHARVFIKLRYGYSAMGAIAVEWRGERVRAITTVDTVWAHGRPRLFVTKRPRQLRREFEIAWLIDTLGVEQIVVEDWLPKARWQGLPFDLRVVMINGMARHVVGRANASPFTNLNLDARRMSRELVEKQVGDHWGRIERLCEQAAGLLPGAGMLGLDVLIGPGCRSMRLLEANAFGDYLPGLLHRGQTTYEAELTSASCSCAELRA